MTTYELIRQLALYPPDTKVVIAHDWSDPVLDASYLRVEDGPAMALHSSKALEALGTGAPLPAV